MRCSYFVPQALVRPRLFRPLAIEIARTNYHRGSISSIGEATTKTGMNPDVGKPAARDENPPGFPQNGCIVSYIGVNHHRNHARERSVPEGQRFTISLHDRESATSMPQHPGGHVDPNGRPTQIANAASVCAGAAADLKRWTETLTEQLAE